MLKSIPRSVAVFVPLMLGVPSVSAQSYYTDAVASDIGFGASVVVSDGEVFVGESQNFYRSGTVYVFRRGTDGWTEFTTITPRETETPNGFGSSVAVSGNRMIVADYGRGVSRGAYVFERTGRDDEWREVAHLMGDDAAESDGFGADVAIAGEWALVGAHAQNDFKGAVYVFRRSARGDWEQVQRLRGQAEGERFGATLALDGEIALIAAPRREGEQGVVTAYRVDDDELVSLGALETHDVNEGDRFGTAIDLRLPYALIGTPRHANGTGAVFAFMWDGENETWNQGTKLVPFDQVPQTQFGAQVAIAGGNLWIGAPGAAGFNGRAYLLSWDEADGFTQAAKFGAEGLRRGDRFGGAVDAEGDVAAVAYPGSDFGSGNVAVFERNPENGHWRFASKIFSENERFARITGGQVNCTDGQVEDFACNDVDLISFLPVDEIGGTHGSRLNDVWGWTDPSNEMEYAIVGRVDGTSFVDVSDPFNPRYLGDLPMTPGSRPSVWRDIKVYENHAFVVADGAGEHGMQVFNLERLRSVRSPQIFEPDYLYDGISSAHNIVINEATGFAYSVGSSGGRETCGGGLHMIDIRRPREPRFAGCFADPQTGRASTGYSHDAMCVVYEGPDRAYRGHEICFGSNETALSISDVTDKQDPVAVSRAEYPNVGYAHQGWITEDHRYFFTDDEGDEVSGLVENTRTLVWDLGDLDDPILLTEYYANTHSTDHNLYIRGNLMFQSNNTAGLRILDVSDPANPTEVGFFDTFPSGEDSAGFHGGSWSNYPFFRSGIVLVTSRREGLFIVRERQELVP
ncbi:MAG: choice-of-anchor B family protein [Gemmatimonadales bacterium]